MNLRSEIRIEKAARRHMADWASLRFAVWPHADGLELRREAESLIRQPGRAIAFLALARGGTAVGFAEATLRSDYVNGCATSPVAFLEGIYVQPDWRLRGVARRLCAAVERWAVDLGCSEMASDTELENTGSQLMHAALDFEETERVVYFRKQLPPRRR